MNRFGKIGPVFSSMFEESQETHKNRALLRKFNRIDRTIYDKF